MPSMDDTDRDILNRIQSDFPITSHPYLAIANDMGLSENDVIKRLASLKKNKIIRRIGGKCYSPIFYLRHLKILLYLIIFHMAYGL